MNLQQLLLRAAETQFELAPFEQMSALVQISDGMNYLSEHKVWLSM